MITDRDREIAEWKLNRVVQKLKAVIHKLSHGGEFTNVEHMELTTAGNQVLDSLRILKMLELTPEETEARRERPKYIDPLKGNEPESEEWENALFEADTREEIFAALELRGERGPGKTYTKVHRLLKKEEEKP